MPPRNSKAAEGQARQSSNAPDKATNQEPRASTRSRSAGEGVASTSSSSTSSTTSKVSPSTTTTTSSTTTSTTTASGSRTSSVPTGQQKRAPAKGKQRAAEVEEGEEEEAGEAPPPRERSQGRTRELEDGAGLGDEDAVSAANPHGDQKKKGGRSCKNFKAAEKELLDAAEKIVPLTEADWELVLKEALRHCEGDAGWTGDGVHRWYSRKVKALDDLPTGDPEIPPDLARVRDIMGLIETKRAETSIAKDRKAAGNNTQFTAIELDALVNAIERLSPRGGIEWSQVSDEFKRLCNGNTRGRTVQSLRDKASAILQDESNKYHERMVATRINTELRVNARVLGGPPRQFSAAGPALPATPPSESEAGEANDSTTAVTTPASTTSTASRAPTPISAAAPAAPAAAATAPAAAPAPAAPAAPNATPPAATASGSQPPIRASQSNDELVSKSARRRNQTRTFAADLAKRDQETISELTKTLSEVTQAMTSGNAILAQLVQSFLQESGRGRSSGGNHLGRGTGRGMGGAGRGVGGSGRGRGSGNVVEIHESEEEEGGEEEEEEEEEEEGLVEDEEGEEDEEEEEEEEEEYADDMDSLGDGIENENEEEEESVPKKKKSRTK